MKLWVGLGNPGAKYARNRHNIGFMALDRIAADHGFAPWRGKFHGQISEGRLGDEKLVLLKPETFMNLSGQAVRAAVDFHRLQPGDITVFHDELDLAPGRMRLKTGGGHAGHNGLRSIHGHLGESYHRVRLGIGHPGHKDAVAGYVLHDFGRADEDWLDDLLRGISDGAAALARGEDAAFQNAVALRTAPPRSGGGAKDGGAGRKTGSPGAVGRPDRPEVKSVAPDRQDATAAKAGSAGRQEQAEERTIVRGPAQDAGVATAESQATGPAPRRAEKRIGRPTETTPDTDRSALQRLIDRFR